MEQGEIYEYFLTRVEEDLSPLGYRRSGKGMLFYRYCADKQVACGIEMQKSGFNYPGSYSFTFNLVCVSVHCFSPQPKTLTLKHLKSSFCYPHNERIGSVCRGRDHWWKITEEYLAEYGLNGYYERLIQADILKSGAYLNEKAKSKESLVSRTGESK